MAGEIKGNLDDYFDGLRNLYKDLKSRGEDLYISGWDPTYLFSINRDLVELDSDGNVKVTSKLLESVIKKGNLEASFNFKRELKPYESIGYSHSISKLTFSELEEKGYAKIFSIDID